LQLFPSTLLISKSNLTLKKHIELFCQNLNNLLTPNNPDILIIGQNSWTINDVRQLKKFFSQKPLSHQNKIGLIFSADQMAPPAQNALLKILEEPGPNHYLVLTTKKPQALLPTILSRCQQIHLSSKKNVVTSAIPKNQNLAQNLKTASKLSLDKDAILSLLSQELNYQQQTLIKNPSPLISKNIKHLIHSLDMIRHNVDPRCALDSYLLS